MSSVLVAVFNEYHVAARVRIALVRDGFPTDRVELTAGCEPGRAGLEPADSMYERFVQYFHVLFTFEVEREQAEQLAECICNGAATITVHPRGAMETARATRILAGAGPLQLLSHDLPNQTPKYAQARPWPGTFGFRGALALCLLIAAYLLAKQALGEVGLRVMPSGLQLNQTQEIEPDQTQPAWRSCFPAKDIRSVIADYFDTYLMLPRLSGERRP
jgi:hypothetical protein